MPRFSRKGVTKILFSETLTDTTGHIPTRAEITGATKLTKNIAATEGFNLENQEIPTPDLESTFTAKIPGDDEAGDSSLTFYEDDASSTLEEALAKGTTGYIIILRKGDVPASKSMDIWPVRVASKSSAITVENEAAKWTAKFSITDTPALDVAVPAAS